MTPSSVVRTRKPSAFRTEGRLLGRRRRLGEPPAPGRGIDLFRSLREIFRALVARGGDGRRLSALVLKSGQRRLVLKQACERGEIPVVRARDNPGRGFNVFKVLREIFRAIGRPECLGDGQGDEGVPPSSRAQRGDPGAAGRSTFPWSAASPWLKVRRSLAMTPPVGSSEQQSSVAGVCPTSRGAANTGSGSSACRTAFAASDAHRIPGMNSILSRSCTRFSGRLPG